MVTAKPLVLIRAGCGTLGVPSGVKQYLLTEGGTLQNVKGALALFAPTQVVTVQPAAASSTTR